MTKTDDFARAVSGYWDTRAEGYSLRTKDELEGVRGADWQERLASNFGDIPPGGKVLDVGCGPAMLAISAAKCGWRAYGCDSSPEMLRHAAENAKAAGAAVELVECDAVKLPFEDESFDAVISRNVLWNLPDPVAALAEWMRILKPGGRILYEDGNHYRYLFDPLFKAVKDAEPAPFGHQPQYMMGVDTARIDKLAETLPLTKELRPGWDFEALTRLGFEDVRVFELEVHLVKDPETDEEKRVVTSFFVTARNPAGKMDIACACEPRAEG